MTKLNDEEIEKIKELSGLMSVEMVRDYFDFSDEKLRNCEELFLKTYKKGKAKLIVKMGRLLVDIALAHEPLTEEELESESEDDRFRREGLKKYTTAESLEALIFFLKTRGGWDEKNDG